jgi:hypothetical protein
MAATLDFFFEFASTYSYPAAMRIGALAREAIADADGQEARSRAASTGEGRRTPESRRHGRRPWRGLWAMYGRRPRCKRNLTFERSVRVQPCIRPLNAAVLAAGPDVIR